MQFGKRRLSFSLRLLLVSATISAVVFAVVAAKKSQVELQIQTTAQIEELGGKVFYGNVIERRDVRAPTWLLKRLGIDTFEGLAQIELEDSEIDDIAFLSHLSGVQHLYLDRTRVDDLTPVSSMTSLRLLSINQTLVTDLAPLKNLWNLEVLSISETKISDLSPLHQLENLKTLYARHSVALETEFNALRAALPGIEIAR